MALTNTAIRNANRMAKPYKLTDEKGLFLLVQPSGGMLWRYKFRIDGRDDAGNPKRIEKKLGLGMYPDVSLKEARELRDEARKQLAKGIDPADQKRRDDRANKVNAANTFNAIALAYIDKCRREGRAVATITKQAWLLKLLDRKLGQRPVVEIEPFEVLEAVRRYETTGRTETAHRALQFASQVFRFAVALQVMKADPTRDLRGALVSHKSKHHAAILEPKRLGELLRAIDCFHGSPVGREEHQASGHQIEHARGSPCERSSPAGHRDCVENLRKSARHHDRAKEYERGHRCQVQVQRGDHAERGQENSQADGPASQTFAGPLQVGFEDEGLRHGLSPGCDGRWAGRVVARITSVTSAWAGQPPVFYRGNDTSGADGETIGNDYGNASCLCRPAGAFP
jgi:hypothetical protein